MAQCRIHRLYSLMRRLHDMGVPFIPDLIRKYIRTVYACDLPFSVELGEGTRFPHNGLGVVIHGATKIGKNCQIYQNVTLGGDGRRRDRDANGVAAVPTIGDDVTIYAGAVVIGPVIIGEGATIAANAVVVTSVPAGAVFGGVPAKRLSSRAAGDPA
jgi:serine O-acetyltransferase